MKRFIVTKLLSARALTDADGVAIQFETREGGLELRFTFEDAGRLIAELGAGRERIRAHHAQAGAPLAEKPRLAERWETGIDPVNQVAVLRAHYEDGSTQDLRIARGDIASIVEFLQQALRRMEPGADMRQ